MVHPPYWLQVASYNLDVIPGSRAVVWLNDFWPDDSGGIQTQDLLLTGADVLTSGPPSLPDDE